MQAKAYANALQDVGDAQAALLLSTQGVNNSLIQQMLNEKGLETEEQYLTMVEAGLLKSKQSLEYAELQNIIATQVGNEECTEAIMNHMGLSTVINKEGIATTKLTSKKLQELVTSGLLTEAQAQEIAMMTGVSIATNAQTASVLPKWIATIKAATLAIWDQVKATLAWMTTSPVGWCTAAVAAIITVTASILCINKYIQKTREEIKETGREAANTIKEIQASMQSSKKTVEEAIKTYESLIDGVNTLTNQNKSLSNDDFEKFLETNNQLADLFPQLIRGHDEEGNAILNIGNNAEEATAKLNALYEAMQQGFIEQAKEKAPEVSKGMFEETRDTRKLYQNLSSKDATSGILGLNFENSQHDLITMAEDYLDGLDSEAFLRSVKNIIDDELGTDLSLGYDEVMGEYMLDISQLTDEEYERARQAIGANMDVLNAEWERQSDILKDEINKEYQSHASSFMLIESGNADYKNLSDNNKLLVDALITGLDYAEYAKTIQQDYDGNVNDFLDAVILNPLYTASEETQNEISKIYGELLSIDPTASLTENTNIIEDYINQLAELLGLDEDGKKQLMINLGYDIDQSRDLVNRAKRIATGNTDSSEVNDYLDTLSQEQLELFVESDKASLVKTQNDVEELINKLQPQAKITIDPTISLSDIEEAYSSFEDIFEEIESGGTVSASSIDALAEKFGELNGGKSLENFRKVLTTMPDDIDACKKALNQLATEYLDQSDLIKNLTVENAKYVESELKKLGVENAHQIVQSRLIQFDYSEADAKAVLINYSRQLTDAKQQEKIASFDLANATANDIAGMINEATAAGIDATALSSYLRQKIQANAIAISTNGDISNLAKLCDALGGTSTYIQQYQSAKEKILNGGTIYGNGTADYEYLKGLEKLANEEIKKAFDTSMTANVNYNPSAFSSSSSGGSEAKDTTKQYNWIETAINRVQEALSRLTKVRDDTYTSWTKRNAALNQEIAKTTEEINLQQRSYEGYMAKANSIGLSQDYINKIQAGTIQIEDITDEGLQEKIDQYQDWYDKAVSCSDAIQDLNLSLSQLAQQKFDNLQQEYDSLISTITAQADIINEQMNRTEEQGYFADKTYYQQLTQYETQELAALRQEYAALQSSLQDAVATGRITEGSQAWSDMKAEILSVEQAIEESTTALVEYNNAMRELDWEIFDYIHERIEQITQESDFLIDLLENNKLYEDNGAFNAEGKAAAALHGVNYNTYFQQSLDYAKELKNIESELAKDQNNRDLIDRREELLKLQQESIVNAEAEKEAIKSLVEDGINLHLEALSELIDKYKESLDAAKDLYDYQKNITQQTANIADLEKILMAYEGDDSEETRKRIQDTRNQLEEARQELQETEWEKYISETEDLLDALYEDYETILNERLDNIDALIETMIEMVNASGSEIRDAISDTTAKVGYDITHTLDTIFGNGGKQTTLISSFMNKFETASTTLQTAINDIKNSIHAMVATPGVSESAGATSNSVGSSSNASNGSVSGNAGSGAAQAAGQAQSTSASPQGDGIASVGDLVTYISGKYHEDSWGNGRSGSQNLNGQVYITKIKAGSPYPYHISRGSTLGNGDLGWVTLDQLQGYKTGARRISNAQYAWLHEDGSELIRTSDGALLTRLGQGDMVFTNEMSQRLWEISKGMLPHSASTDVNLSNLLPYADRQKGVINNSNDITIQLPNVTNYAEFKRELQKDSKFAGFVQEITLGQASGKPRLNSNKY